MLLREHIIPLPSEVLPSEVLPSEVPSEVLPSEVLPSEVLPSEVYIPIKNYATFFCAFQVFLKIPLDKFHFL